jgi:hypothetical protein
MLSPLDPGSGCAVWQRAPAMPELPTTTTTFHLPFARVKPSLTPMRRGRLQQPCCRHATRVDGLERSSGRNASPSGITPSNISSPAPEPTRGSRTKVSPGARAQHQIPTRPRSPPSAIDLERQLTSAGRISKQGAQVRDSADRPGDPQISRAGLRASPGPDALCADLVHVRAAEGPTLARPT